MPATLIFCHGWGFAPEYWLPFITPHFKEHWNLGYFSEPHIPTTTNTGPRIGIGHSLGFLKLLESGQPFDAMICLQGFTSFLGNDVGMREKRLEESNTLFSHFKNMPEKTLRYFYRRSGCASLHLNSDKEWTPRSSRGATKLENQRPHSLTRWKTLEKDLDTLIHHTQTLPKNLKVLVLGAQKDVIVPVHILEDNFLTHANKQTHIHPSANHMLLHSDTTWVLKHAHTFIESL